ncbi:Angiopoietin-related protein 7 [Folsomia candida]|uniref:Angiopoietin-related protein 7 n=1 Tax=Folsomia candida TaxID=158441 RepID=A0A226D0M6_FOLCA|nr:Angiopoietin-related protein 7 [Folsomia candida]
MFTLQQPAKDFYHLIEGADLNEEQTLNLKDLMERLAAQLSNIPTKDDFAAKIEAMEMRLDKKLESLQRDLEALVKSDTVKGKVIREETAYRRNRRSMHLPEYAASDYRLGILASEVQKSSFNESCRFVEQLLTLQEDEIASLKEIKSTSFNVSQGLGNVLKEFESLKHYMNNSYPSSNRKSVPCMDDSDLSNAKFLHKKLVCDEEWILIQQRGTPILKGKGRTDFEKNWNEYENGFGNLDGDFWLGLKTIHELTVEGNTQLRVDLEDWEGNKKYAMFDTFRVANVRTKYNLTVDGYTGTAGNSLIRSNGQQFSTYDKDNDGWIKNCAADRRGGWWYGFCSDANLNSIYHNSGEMEKAAVGVHWNDWRGTKYSLKKVQMKIRKPPRG